MKYIMCILTTLLLVETSFARDVKDVFFGTATERIEVPFGEKTVLIFSKKVKSHSKTSNYQLKPEDETNPDYTTFTISPNFTSGTSRVSFILEDGKNARLEFKTVQNLESGFKELTYEVKPKAYVDVSKAPPIGEVELLKAMIRDDSVTGYKKRTLSKSVPSGRRGVTSKLVRTYKGRNLHGYVFQLKNKMTRTKVDIDVRKLKLGSPNLAILSQADFQILAPKGKGDDESFVRIVAKPSSQYKAILMPMTARASKKGKK